MKKSPIALIGAHLSKQWLFAATGMACMGVAYAAAVIDQQMLAIAIGVHS